MKLTVLFLLHLIGIATGAPPCEYDGTKCLFGPGFRHDGSYGRTSLCSFIVDGVQNGLANRELSVVVQRGTYFEHDVTEEVSATNPSGILAKLLDELSFRAHFTWRNSFVSYNETTVDVINALSKDDTKLKFDKMLNWTAENFDLSVANWMVTPDRAVEARVLFLHAWFDGSIILVDHGNEQPLHLLNWMKPFDDIVWLLILTTLIFSAIVHQLIEGCYQERGKRSIQAWFSENIYLSFMSFCSQHNHGTPSSNAGRIFLFSFAFWSFLVGAAYTANLASLLVGDALTSDVNSLDEAMQQGLRICVEDGTAIMSTVNEITNDRFRKYDNLRKYVTGTSEMYEDMANYECDVLVGTRQDFEVKKNEEKNGCNLVEAGETIYKTHCSFATRFDPIENCSSVLAYVLDAHLTALEVGGELSDMWATFIENSEEDQCEKVFEENRRELLSVEGSTSRELIAVNTASGQANEEELKVEDMTGIFVVHIIGTCVALCFVAGDYLMKKRASSKNGESKTKNPNSVRVEQVPLRKENELEEFQARLVELKRDYDTKNLEYFMGQLNALFDAYIDVWEA